MNTTDILEKGDIYFFYRPAEGETEVKGLPGVQRFLAVLRPEGKERYRSLIVGQKKLPSSDDVENRYWGFVARVSGEPDEIKESLRRADIRGAPPEELPRPVGEGVYAIARHEDHTDLVYALELPEEPGEAQEDLRIRKEAAYVLSIKNPKAGAPPGAGLEPEDRADYPENLEQRFGDHRWVSADPPDFLDHEGAEFLLIATHEGVPEELGGELEPQAETPESADVLNDLRIERGERRLEPLFEGAWR